jgi:hypothetical protein
MTSYDIVVGLDNPTLNSELAMIYQAIYPNLFTGKIDINSSGIASIGFDVKAAPVADLAPPASARAHIEHAFHGHASLTADMPAPERELLIDRAVGATFGLSAPQLQLTVNYSNESPPTVVDAGLSVTAIITTGTDQTGQNYVSLQAIAAAISIPSDPALAEIINSIGIGPALKYINGTVLSPFKIPPLQYNSLLISLPVPAIQDEFALAFAALGSTQPDVPDPYGWPGNTVFFGSDAAVLVAAANTQLPLGPSSGFSWEAITGSAGAQIGPLGPGNVTINNDGSLSVGLPCNAWAQLVLHTPWWLPDFSFGPSATAIPAATAIPSVVDGVLLVTIDSIDDLTFNFSWGNIPDWVMPILGPLLSGLADALGALLAVLITQAVRGLQIPVLTLPDVKIPIGGTTYALSIAYARTMAGQGPAGPLLLVCGEPSFGPAS